MARFFNVDPLSEKYAYQSHYNFSENRVVDGRELEGLEWVPAVTVPIIPTAPGSGVTAGNKGIYQAAKNNAINNYNGILRLLGNQATIITTIGSTGIGIATRVLNTKEKKGESKAENKGDSENKDENDDGRDRKKAKVIDEYDPKNPEEGAFKEQKAINERGGIDKLDNKRNEMNPERYNNAKTKYENKQHK